MMEALLMLAALVVVWLAGLIALVWAVPAMLVLLATGATEKPSARR
jgi:hypothetical protein